MYVCVCVCERERESVCVCVRERERECVCVCVCVLFCCLLPVHNSPYGFCGCKATFEEVLVVFPLLKPFPS